jgi:hypothetical protein
MGSVDDEKFRPKLSPPKARGQARIPFISRVVKASAKAGEFFTPPEVADTTLPLCSPLNRQGGRSDNRGERL